MGEKDVIVPLYEYGDWRDHEIPREAAQPAVRDMIKQMSDEPICWLFIGMPLHQLQELAEAVRTEMLARERARNRQTALQDGLKLLGDA
jgi:hypothetical protein